jgi:hypothetical protein
MRFSSTSLLRRAAALFAAPHADRVRHWLRGVDPFLAAMAGIAEPATLAVLVATGLALPRLKGDWAPVPACRTLHLLAGVALALMLAWRGGAMLIRCVFRPIQRPGTRPAFSGPPGGWRRMRDTALEAVYHAALVIQVVTGLIYAWARRGGEVPPWLPGAIQAQALHALGAPYLYGVLLLLFYVEGRRRARALLQELRSP